VSQENVQLIRGLYELVPHILDADAQLLDRAFRDSIDDDFELQLPPDYPEGEQVVRGRESIDAMVAMLRETWSQWRFVPERFFGADNRVVVFAHIVAVGHESGVPIELETTHVWTIRDGRVKSMRPYRNRSEALDAAGLQD
jgi:ketosteroid isomerase-like protein